MHSINEIVLVEDWESTLSSFSAFDYTLLLKYSSSCAKSHTIKYEINDWLEHNSQKFEILLTLLDIKKRPEISDKAAEYFSIPHASPQLIIIDKNGTVFKFANQYDAIDLIQTL